MICLKIVLIFQQLVLWQKNIYILYKTKNKNKNNTLVQLIESRWSDLKDKIKEMSEDEKKKKNKMNNQIKD